MMNRKPQHTEAPAPPAGASARPELDAHLRILSAAADALERAQQVISDQGRRIAELEQRAEDTDTCLRAHSARLGDHEEHTGALTARLGALPRQILAAIWTAQASGCTAAEAWAILEAELGGGLVPGPRATGPAAAGLMRGDGQPSPERM